jgi:hypothetical protein
MQGKKKIEIKQIFFSKEYLIILKKYLFLQPQINITKYLKLKNYDE